MKLVIDTRTTQVVEAAQVVLEASHDTEQPKQMRVALHRLETALIAAGLRMPAGLSEGVDR